MLLGHITFCTENSIWDDIAVSSLRTRNYCVHFHVLTLQCLYECVYTCFLSVFVFKTSSGEMSLLPLQPLW